MRILFLFVLFLLSLSSLLSEEGKWSKIGPEGGIVTRIVRDVQNQDVFYIGTYCGGVFKSVNEGASWVEKSEGI